MPKSTGLTLLPGEQTTISAETMRRWLHEIGWVVLSM